MKWDELFSEIDDEQATLLDVRLKELERPSSMENQIKLTLNKIHMQMRSDTDMQPLDADRTGNGCVQSGRRFAKRRYIVLFATIVLLFGVAAHAGNADWDYKMAQMLGISSVMHSLEGGYVRIGQTCVSGGITMEASQSIGDQNTQWIRFDTDVPWSVGEDGYYLPDDTVYFRVMKKGFFHRQIWDGGMSIYSFNQNGYVSFLLCAVDYHKINRADIEVSFSGIREYTDKETDEAGTLISDGVWTFAWHNAYVANTVTSHPFRMVKLESGGENKELCNCLIYAMEISPVSIRITAWKDPKIGRQSEWNMLQVDSVILKDGTQIQIDGFSVAGLKTILNWIPFFRWRVTSNCGM
ncbi:MAG: hypothetical protein J6P60_02430 [Lachnospiraceae bacterium]|nr:hypothetical protein [Lachnospiraceae bacterium]